MCVTALRANEGTLTVATTERGPRKGRHLTANGSQIRVGVGRPADASDRCRATHDVPYTLRCVKPQEHVILGLPGQMVRRHEDKEGGIWG